MKLVQYSTPLYVLHLLNRFNIAQTILIPKTRKKFMDVSSCRPTILPVTVKFFENLVHRRITKDLLLDSRYSVRLPTWPLNDTTVPPFNKVQLVKRYKIKSTAHFMLITGERP